MDIGQQQGREQGWKGQGHQPHHRQQHSSIPGAPSRTSFVVTWELLVSSGAGALHRKSSPGPWGSPSRGRVGLESLTTPLPDRRRAARRESHQRGPVSSFVFCLLCFGVVLASALSAQDTGRGPGNWAPAVTASHNPEAEPRATPCTGRIPRLRLYFSSSYNFFYRF